MLLAGVKRAGFTANLAASSYFAFQAPTDSIRVWYPTIWSYLGEYFLLFLICLSCVFFVMQRFPSQVGDGSRSEGGFGLLKLLVYGIGVLCVDVVVSAYLWFVAPRSGDLPTLSYPRHNFG
ncbi:MAG TPA: hypothetical protein VFF39_11380, partial [Verrucomicrobiae bacterium]|nr:hypothetical protein [Verrucomicrobiae bacterium]